MLTLVGLVAFSLHSAAGVLQSDPISTDRPDFTEGSRAVPFGVFQFESGVTYEELDGPGNATSLGEALIRYGFQPGSELRIALPNHVSLDGTGADVTGFGDLALGFKHELNGDEKVEFALLGQVAFPTGVAGLRAARATPMAAFIWATESGGTPFGGQIQAEWPGGRTDLRHTFVAGFPVGDRLGAFADPGPHPSLRAYVPAGRGHAMGLPHRIRGLRRGTGQFRWIWVLKADLMGKGRPVCCR